MRAMILAAGRGERMRPLTDHTPKPLLKVAGRPLIEWHLLRLVQAGFKEIVVNHAWLGEQIQAYLGDGSRWHLSIQHSPETHALETAGGIANAMDMLGADPFLVINGDVWTDWDFKQAVTMGHTLQNDRHLLASLVLVTNPPHHSMGDFVLDANGMLKDRPSEQTHAAPPTAHTFSGIGIYKPELFAHLAPGLPAPLAPLLRQAMQKQQVAGVLYEGQWHDIGTVARLTQLDHVLGQ